MRNLTTRPKRGQSYQAWLEGWMWALERMESFTTKGALRGRYLSIDTVSAPLPTGHRLNDTEVARYMACDPPYYIVLSYQTPIAYADANGWHLVEQKFSSTTSNHQRIIRTVLGWAAAHGYITIGKENT